MLERVLPVLWRYRVAFDVLKDSYVVSLFNGYAAGLGNVGKFISVYCKNRSEGIALLRDIERVAAGIDGPEVPGMLRVGRISYVAPEFFKHPEKERKYQNLPKVIVQEKPPRLLGGNYIPVKLLRRLPKGDTFIGVNIRRFSFSQCLIEQGRRHAFVDFCGRDMFNRLEWQYRVLKEIASLKISNLPLDLIYKKHCAYLVLDYLEGNSLRTKVSEHKQGICWKDMTTDARLYKLLFLTLK